jgi:hypothetical protein
MATHYTASSGRTIAPMSDETLSITDNCGGCGQPLPTFVFRRLIGPWNKRQHMRAAHDGTINVQTCPSCGFSGPYELPWLLCSPETNRLVFVALAPQTVFERPRQEAELAALLSDRLGATHAWNALPKLYAPHSWMAPGVIRTTPAEFTQTLTDAEACRVARLRYSPAKKAAMAAQQLVDAITNCRARQKTNEEFGFSILPTAFEMTERGRKYLRDAFLDAAAQHGDLASVANQFISNIANIGTEWRSLPAHSPQPFDSTLEERIDALPDLVDYEVNLGDAFTQRYAWRDAVRDLLRSDIPELAADLGEFYMLSIARMSYTPLDVELIVLFSICIERAGGRAGDLESFPHLDLCRQLMEGLNYKEFPNGITTMGTILEYSGHSRVRFGKIEDAKDCFEEAIKLYSVAEELEQLRTAVGALLDICLATRDESRVRHLLRTHAAEIEQLDPLYRPSILNKYDLLPSLPAEVGSTRTGS